MHADFSNPKVEGWLAIAEPLMRSLLPNGAGLEVFGHGMPPADFAALVDREAPRVDHALVAMATASGEAEVKAIAGQLSGDTLIALFSRWVHYLGLWRSMLHDPAPLLWVPPKMDQVWRAVFLSMTGEGIHSTAAAQALWPEVFGALEE